MEVSHRVADATFDPPLAPTTELRSVGSGESRYTLDINKARTGLISQPLSCSNCFSARGEVMFGPYPKSKALCSCGEIAEVDSAVVRLKRRLGKDVECRVCRNERIAKELDALELHFLGQSKEGNS